MLTTEYYTGKAKEAEETEKATAVKKTETKSNPSTSSGTAKSSGMAKSSGTATAVAKATTTSTAKTTAKTNTSTGSGATGATAAVTRFWVQVAAYTNKKTAENAREILSENKITSDIFTYQDNKNRLFYRVRVGPYTTKSEAEYWQAKISKISDFSKEQSFVTSTND